MNAQRIVVYMACAVGLLSASPAPAAEVVYGLFPNYPVPGQFRLYVRALGNDHAGLSGYGLDFTGNVTSINHLSPMATTAQKGGLQGPAGFTLARSADAPPFLPIFPSGHLVATQDIANPDVILIHHLAQGTPSSFAAEGITPLSTPVSPSWGGKSILLAAGTHSGPIGIMPNGPNWGANVFISDADWPVKLPETVRLANLAEDINFFIPEPTSAALALASAVALSVLARRKLTHDIR